MIKFKFSIKFRKQYRRAPKNIQQAVDNRLRLFVDDPHNRTLNNHALTGQFGGYRSINVNGDWRAIYSLTDFETILFELLGTHGQLYR